MIIFNVVFYLLSDHGIFPVSQRDFLLDVYPDTQTKKYRRDDITWTSLIWSSTKGMGQSGTNWPLICTADTERREYHSLKTREWATVNASMIKFLYKRLIIEAPIAISVIISFSLVLSLWQIEPIVSKHSKLISNTSMLFFHLSSFLKYSWKILSLFVKLHSPW